VYQWLPATPCRSTMSWTVRPPILDSLQDAPITAIQSVIADLAMAESSSPAVTRR